MTNETFTLANAKQHQVSLGEYQRQDGLIFKIDATLFETPGRVNYWLAYIDAVRNNGEHVPFKLIVQKSHPIDFAVAILTGSVLEQVKSILSTLASPIRPLTITESPDGWTLL
jgi:hypothetical protein